MKISSDYHLRNLIKRIMIDSTNGYWCEKCECYHPYQNYVSQTTATDVNNHYMKG